jgi:hypothetical protein
MNRIACVSLLTCILSGVVSICNGNVNVDSNGTRILSKVPPVGVHPRIYFSPEDMPEIKERYLSSQMGQVIGDIIQKQFKGSKPALEQFAALDLSDPMVEQIQQYFRSDEGRNIQWGMYSFDAVMRNNAQLKQLMIKVITNYARLILASKEKALGGEVKGWTGDVLGKVFNVWKNDSFDVSVSWTFGAAGYAVSYDLLYNDMTPQQQQIVRKAIAAATQGRRSHGMGAPQGRAVSNHYGYHGDLAVMLAAIEGEPGYDAQTYKNIEQVLTDYFEVGFEQAGACHEDLYGPNLGLRAGSQGLMALARRGNNLFATEKYRNFMCYMASEFEPYSSGSFLGGASGGPGLPYPTCMIIAKYMYPKDPVVNYNWRYYVGDDYKRNLARQGWLDYALFGMDWDGQKDVPASLAGTDLKLTSFYPERGKLITRSDWSQEALCLHLDARPDAFMIGHDTVDRGHFMLSALGRAWAVRGSWAQFRTSKDHSLVHIDGKAQEWKAPSVKFLSHQDKGDAVVGIADLKYAYDWQWSPPWPDKDKKYGVGWEHEMSDPRNLGWPTDPDWLPHKLYDEPGIGYIGSWMWRKPYNPVQKAFRSAIMMRGKHPYVFIVDDVKKDDAEHVYDWYMQVAIDLTEASCAGDDMILKDQTDRRMLVRVIQAQGDPQSRTMKLESYVAGKEKNGKDVKGNRVIISTRAKEPQFKVLLLPYRDGEELPRTVWDTTNRKLTVN